MKRIIAITALALSLAAGSFAGGTWWVQQVRRCARERARRNGLHLPDAPGVPQRASWQLPDLRHAARA